MTTTINFPTPASTANHPSQANQIITLASAITMIPQGGPATYVDVSEWHRDNAAKASPYTNIVIEFQATEGNIIIGDGSQAEAIGLFGEIDATGERFLLGVLGVNLGATFPQIPISEQGNNPIGYAQPSCNIAVYDRIAVGGIFGDVPVGGEAAELTIVARPIRTRHLAG